jgi:hypothetical protein
MQQQHLMQMNQGMMGGGYASPAAVTTDLIQQVVIPGQISSLPFLSSAVESFPFAGTPFLYLSMAFVFCLV